MGFLRNSIILLVAVSLAGCLSTSTQAIEGGFTETEVGYAHISSMIEVKDKLAYRAREANGLGGGYLIVFGGEKSWRVI